MQENKRRGEKLRGESTKSFQQHITLGYIQVQITVQQIPELCPMSTIVYLIYLGMKVYSTPLKILQAIQRKHWLLVEILSNLETFQNYFLSLPAILKQNLPKENEIISSASMFQNFPRMFPFSSSTQESSIKFLVCFIFCEVFLGHVITKNKKH